MLNAARREDGAEAEILRLGANWRRASHAQGSSACKCVPRAGRGIKLKYLRTLGIARWSGVRMARWVFRDSCPATPLALKFLALELEFEFLEYFWAFPPKKLD